MKRTTTHLLFSSSFRRIAAVGLMISLVGSAAVAGRPAQKDEYPTTAEEAMLFYEGWVDEWTDGPAEMFMNPQEREIWGDLEDRQQRADFIQWFWDRRAPDGRRVGNEFKETFYQRVAEVNRRYRGGSPRGWRSDRGRVRIMFGEADYVARQTASEVVGGVGPDFEVWSYWSFRRNDLAFRGVSGEFRVYFLETSIGRFEAFDFRWGAGVWDPNIRMAFEMTIEDSIVDPTLAFKAAEPALSYVREMTEGALPVEVPLDAWPDIGGGGAVSLPVRMRLGDLLFQPEGDQFVATLEAVLTLRPGGGAGALRVSRAWEIRLGQEELLAIGNGSFVTSIAAAAEPGEYEAELTVSHPLAGTEASWSQPVTVTANSAAAIVVGQAALSLDPAGGSATAVLMSEDKAVDSGGTLVVGAWIFGAEPRVEALSLQLEKPDGARVTVVPEQARWLEGLGGPLLVTVRLPEVEIGDYRLLVDFGTGSESASAPLKVAR